MHDRMASATEGGRSTALSAFVPKHTTSRAYGKSRAHYFDRLCRAMQAPHRDRSHDLWLPKNDLRQWERVAVVDGNLVGTAMSGYDGHRGWIYYVAVHSKYRRMGIGSALMKKIESSLVEIGCPKLNLQIRANNAEVKSFYESLGLIF